MTKYICITILLTIKMKHRCCALRYKVTSSDMHILICNSINLIERIKKEYIHLFSNNIHTYSKLLRSLNLTRKVSNTNFCCCSYCYIIFFVSIIIGEKSKYHVLNEISFYLNLLKS